MPSSTCSSFLPINSSPGFATGLSTGSIVPSFVSTYCMLGNSSPSHPLFFGSYGASSGALPATSQFFSSAFFTHPPWLSLASLLHKPSVVGPVYSPIPEKLVTKIKGRQFVNHLADLLTKRPRIVSHKRTWMANCSCLPRRGYER